MSSYEKLQHRYENDATFRAIVTMLEGVIHQLQLTPFELREAAMFAAIRFEERAMRPIHVALSDLEQMNRTGPYR